ncbi:MAG: hypothetical protein KGL31_09265 [candidate division NC10 bacterium]|nr:hypothetical protein [candidate division NC10 bacterium]
MTPVALPAFQAIQEAAVGSLFCLSFLHSPPIRRGFFQTCALTLVSALGVGLWVSQTPTSLVFFVLVLLYAGAFWMPDGQWPRRILWVSLAVGTVGMLIPSLLLAQESSSVLEIAVQIATTFASALLMGSALTGMLLGHYYLRDPRLPVALIRRLATLFLLSTALQGLLIIVTLGSLYLFGGAEAAFRIGLLSSSYLAVFLSRVCVGILGSFVLACVIWDTLRIPNVQSATGFFYLAILTGAIGEFLGRFLWHSTLIPL